MKAKIGSLVAVRLLGHDWVPPHLRGAYLFGHVVEVKQVVASKKIIKTYRVIWDNGNDFTYNEQEMKPYLQNIRDIKN